MKRSRLKPSHSSLVDLTIGVLAVGLVVGVLVIITLGPSSDEEFAPTDSNANGPGAQAALGGPGGGGPGGPGGVGGRPRRSREPVKVLVQFDEDRNGWLNATERKAALVHLETQSDAGAAGGGRGPGGPGGRGRGGPGSGGEQGESEPGLQVAPADVASLPDAPLYDPFSLRTLFLEFDNDDWEKQLEAFRYTDVDVPANLEVDGQTMRHVGIRFRGNTSYSTIASGRKRPLNITLDLVHPKQKIGGYSTMNLLNANGDATMLRSVLYYEIAREYIPAFKANFMRVVINGESWGVYANVQQFDSNFTKDFFGTPKGVRWKVPGSPAGQGGLAYLGDEIEPYREIFELKSKEDPKSWVGLMLLSQTLNETPTELLASALAPILDVDGVLKFLALDNVLVNNDGFWVRASDYSIYQDSYGKFHVMPYDANETFSVGRGGGGPPGGGAPGGARGGRGQTGRGRAGAGGFSPGTFVAPALIAEADGNEDGEAERDEFLTLADAWFLDAGVDQTATLDRDQFVAGLTKLVDRQPESSGPPAPGGRAGFSPIAFIGGDLFTSVDADEDGQVAHADLENRLGAWFTEWGGELLGALSTRQMTEGINATLIGIREQNGGATAQAGPRRGRGNTGGANAPGGFRGRGGAGGGPGGAPGGRPSGGGIDLDPLVLENDESRPLASKLLAVPELRARYLSYVRDIAENWLDWEKNAPRILRYQALIEEDIKADTRKLHLTEEFYDGVDGSDENSLRAFFERRRAFLLEHEEVKTAKRLSR